MSREILLKICTQHPRANLRTFSCWHFSRKIHLHGFFDKSSDITNFCSDITFFFNNFYTVHASPMVHTNKKLWNVARQLIVPKKCRSGHSKCQKMPKCDISPVSPGLICHFEHVKRSARSRTIRSKIVIFIRGIQKYNFYTWGNILKKSIFWGVWHDELGWNFLLCTFRSTTHHAAPVAAEVINMKMIRGLGSTHGTIAK